MIVSRDDFDIKKVKLIIWDLDNTFWNGTISEEGCTEIVSNIQLIKKLSKRGIVNSICSKNDYDVCKKQLESLGCWEYFVFPSIDWSSKGNRVSQIVADMGLRPENVLFLDDEKINLQNVLSVDYNFMCAHVQDVVDLIEQQSDFLKIDSSCSRLRQYKVLETKCKEKTNYANDEEFLKSAGIRIAINQDCLNNCERILDLINRSNQLNYTKKRLVESELEELLKSDEYSCSYISCTDNFGKYGIIGFYAIHKKEHRLEHFVFSCRTLGMGIEQYIYAKIGYPLLSIVGDVVSHLDKTSCPDWINEVDSLVTTDDARQKGEQISILVKGPCDIAQIVPFFADNTNFVEEMTYVSRSNENMSIEAHNHSSQIVLCDNISEQKKTELLKELPFIDDVYFTSSIFNEYHDYVIISMLVDYSLGVYKNICDPELLIAYNQYLINITDEKNWKELCNNQKELSIEFLTDFSRKWKYIGRISEQQLWDNLNYIRFRLPEKTKLILLTGSEIPYSDADFERIDFHKKMNRVVKRFCNENCINTKLVDVNNYINDKTYFHDTVNHYKKIVYYHMAKEISEFVNKGNKEKMIRIKDESFLQCQIRKQQIDLIKRKIKKVLTSILK